MSPSPLLTAVLAFLTVPVWAEVPARPASPPAPSRIDVRANGESISEVLDRIARQTGMRVTYEGGAPRARITRQVSGVTPAQAVVGVLDGQGLSYFMELDRTSTQVQTLLIVNVTAARTQTASGGRRQVPAMPDAAENAGDEAENEPPMDEAPQEQPVQQQGPRQFRKSEALNQVEPEREPAPPQAAPAEQPAVAPLPTPNLGGVPGAFTNFGPPPTPTPLPTEAPPAPGEPRRRRPQNPPGGVQ
jgi:hypothetical protein